MNSTLVSNRKKKIKCENNIAKYFRQHAGSAAFNELLPETVADQTLRKTYFMYSFIQKEKNFHRKVFSVLLLSFIHSQQKNGPLLEAKTCSSACNHQGQGGYFCELSYRYALLLATWETRLVAETYKESGQLFNLSIKVSWWVLYSQSQFMELCKNVNFHWIKKQNKIMS